MEILAEIDRRISRKHLLQHPFYRAWSEGMISLECLKEYALEYYQHVKAFPTYLSAIHARTEDASTRLKLLQNLIDEEAGSPNHPDLWRAFAKSLGATEAELDQHIASGAIREVIDTFRHCCREGTLAEGIASLYAYESQIPDICISKISGLRNHYGFTRPADWHYFTVHIEADREHAAAERQLLADHLTNTEERGVIQAVEKVLDALWAFLSSLCDRYAIACQPVSC